MDFMGMMKQAKQMQAKMAKLQEDLAVKTIEAASGGGAVKVTANGKNEIIKVSVSPELLKDGDAAMLEDLILTATNQALSQIRELTAKEMAKITGGMLPPGLF